MSAHPAHPLPYPTRKISIAGRQAYAEIPYASGGLAQRHHYGTVTRNAYITGVTAARRRHTVRTYRRQHAVSASSDKSSSLLMLPASSVLRKQ